MGQAAGTVAAGLGHLLRFAVWCLRGAPGIVGPIAVLWGLWQFDPRIAWVVGGLVLVLADLRIGHIRPAAKEPK